MSLRVAASAALSLLLANCNDFGTPLPTLAGASGVAVAPAGALGQKAPHPTATKAAVSEPRRASFV